MKFLAALSLKAKIIAGAVTVAAIAGTAAVVIVLSAMPEAFRLLKIFEMTGTSVINRADTGAIDAYTGMNLESGDIVEVGEESTMILSLDSDKYLSLDPSTVLELIAEGTEEDSKTTVNLRSGGVLNEITEPLSDESSYSVNTPKATMAVRGTSFYVSVMVLDDGSYITDISVFHGKVEVQLIDEEGNPRGDPVMVQPNESVAILTVPSEGSITGAEINGTSCFILRKNDGSDTFAVLEYGENPIMPLNLNIIPKNVIERILNTHNKTDIVLTEEVLNTLLGDNSFSANAETTAQINADETTAETTVPATTDETTIPETTTAAATEETTASETAVPETTVTEETVIPSEITSVSEEALPETDVTTAVSKKNNKADTSVSSETSKKTTASEKVTTTAEKVTTVAEKTVVTEETTVIEETDSTENDITFEETTVTSETGLIAEDTTTEESIVIEITNVTNGTVDPGTGELITGTKGNSETTSAIEVIEPVTTETEAAPVYYTVNFVSDPGGIMVAAPQTVEAGGYAEEPTEYSPSININGEEYTFWEFESPLGPITTDTDILVKYVKPATVFSVYVTDDGTTTLVGTYDEGGSFTLPQPAGKTGATFKYWGLRGVTSGGALKERGQYQPGESVTADRSKTYEFESNNDTNIRFEAVYEDKTPATITYVYNGVTYKTENRYVGDQFLVPGFTSDDATAAGIPAETSYTFNGYKYGNNQSCTIGDTITIEGDLTLNADIAISVTVTFLDHADNVIGTSTGNAGSAIADSPTAPARNGYSFTGWLRVDNGASFDGNIPADATTDFSVKADYLGDLVTITFTYNGNTYATYSGDLYRVGEEFILPEFDYAAAGISSTTHTFSAYTYGTGDLRPLCPAGAKVTLSGDITYQAIVTSP